MQFSDVLASSVHDIKNSLGLVMNTLDRILSDPDTRIGDPRSAKVLQLEAQRANSNLVQLLSLYKLEKQQLAVNLLEHNVEDFLDEILAENAALMHSLGVEIETDCDVDFNAYFDENLVRGVLNSVVGNAERYTRDRIRLCAGEEDGYAVFRVEDNGNGFPGHMLDHAVEAPQSGENSDKSHTQLGLYFASEVARLHKAGDREGYIRLRNGVNLEGGCFELWLP